MSPRHDKANQNDTSQLSLSSSVAARSESSPLRVAASLIQSLDIAHTEMASFAADAAVDAERARRNARTAQEIARRYQTRAYSTFKIDELGTSAFATDKVHGTTTTRPKHPEILRFNSGPDHEPNRENQIDIKKESADIGDKVDELEHPLAANSTTGAAAPSSPRFITPRPKHPSIMRFKNLSPSQNSIIRDFTAKIRKQNDCKIDVNEETKNDDDCISVETPNRSSNLVQNMGGFHSPTSLQRIAQHHADDVLQISLELERTRQALRTEQRLHKDCQSSLDSLRSVERKFKLINQKLVEKHRTEMEKSINSICELEEELGLSKQKLEAAEEDAQLALDLAKDSAEQRDIMEESLLKSQEELELLKNNHGGERSPAITASPKHVHFVDEDINSVTKDTASSALTQSNERTVSATKTLREHGPPRSMIAAGRQILLRRNMSPHDAVNRLEVSPRKSVERRRKLCQRLNDRLNESHGEDDIITRLSSSPSRTPLSPTLGNSITNPLDDSSPINDVVTKTKLEEYHNAINILQISGKRLDLDGYMWREQGSKTTPSNNSMQIDILTRQYCQDVEVRTI